MKNINFFQIELDSLLQRMSDCGIDSAKAMEIIKEKKEKFEKDCAAFDSKNN